jgi:hypothetical protein
MPVETNGTFLIDSALKGMTWERAKGELRALVALQGSYGSRAVGDTSEQTWEKLEKRVDAFIKYVEDNGLVD